MRDSTVALLLLVLSALAIGFGLAYALTSEPALRMIQ